MAVDTRLPAITLAMTTLAPGDLFYVVDVSGTTDHASGDEAKMTAANVYLDANTWAATTTASTSETLALVDAFTMRYYSAATLVTVTVPTNAAVAFPVGTRMLLMSTGAGGLTLTTTSLTLLGSSPKVTIAQNEGISLEKVAVDTWAILGGTA